MEMKDSGTGIKEVRSSTRVAVEDQRQAKRSMTFLQALLIGNYGTFKAFIANLSYMGALVNVTIEDLGLPPETEKVSLLNQVLKDQFGKGVVIRFTGTDLELEAEVVHARFNHENHRLCALIGCKFRRPLFREECILLKIDPPPRQSPVPSLLHSTLPVDRVEVQTFEEDSRIHRL